MRANQRVINTGESHVIRSTVTAACRQVTNKRTKNKNHTILEAVFQLIERSKLVPIRWLLHVGDVELANIHEVASDGCRCGHDRADQVRAAVFALAAFEIAV